MVDEEIKLVPRWCEEKDILRGWVILHRDVTHSRGLRHLQYIDVHCLETKKSAYCRIFGPGTRPYNNDSESIVKSSIYMDAHFQQILGIEDGMGKKAYTFKIDKVSRPRYYINSLYYHPDDGVRVGAFLGIVSLFLGLVSLGIALG